MGAGTSRRAPGRAGTTAAAAGRAARIVAHALATLAMGALASCSLILDWNGYTGRGEADAADAAEEDVAPPAPEAAACSPTSCGGCCTADGVCSPGLAAGDACGTAGAACVDCTKQGQGCTNGVCAPIVDSGPTCTNASCVAMGYTCPDIPIFVGTIKGAPCCQMSGECGCTLMPLGMVTCGKR